MGGNAKMRYVLGEFEIEPAVRRIYRRDGTPLHLATRPFRVLLHLVAHRDRLVTRAELLDQFWDGREVYDDCLTRCMSSVRKALDDQADPARYIETRWAEGYRYIGPFEEQTASGQSTTAAPAGDSHALSAVSQSPAPAAVDNQPNGVFTTPSFKWSALRTFGLAAAMATLSLVALLGNSSQRVVTERSVAVMPLENLSGEAASGYFSAGLTDSLISTLSTLDGVTVASHGSVSAFKGGQSTPQEVGRRLHVAYILEGSVRMNQESVRISLRLAETQTGQVVWASGLQQFAITDVFATQDAVAHAAANHVGARLSAHANAAQRAVNHGT